MQTSATCDDGSDPAAIELSAAETVTCTFTNARKATVTVTKTEVSFQRCARQVVTPLFTG